MNRPPPARATPPGNRSPMNRYGHQASEHWARFLPRTVAAMPDPARFFSTLGLQVEARIEYLAEQIAGTDRAGETYLDKLGRLREARISAESQVLTEMVLLPPEDHAPEDHAPQDHAPQDHAPQDETAQDEAARDRQSTLAPSPAKPTTPSD